MPNAKKLSEIIKSLFKKLRNNKLNKRKKILIGSACSLFLILICFISALASVDKGSLSLIKLQDSYKSQELCHEECREERENNSKILSDSLKKKNQKLENKIELILLSKDEGIEFKKELINILSFVYKPEDIPAYLNKFLENQNADSEIKTLIFNKFIERSDVSLSLKYYLNLLSEPNDNGLKLEAARALSNIPDKKNIYSKSQLELIKSLTIDPDTDNKLRASLVLLISEYYSYFPTESQTVLKQIYNSKNADTITKIFAADTLNRYLKDNKLSVPEATPEEWENYYNN